MKNLNSQTVLDLLEDVAQALMQTLRAGARTLRRMSWPALMLACVLLAFVLTILPLALFLFACFLLLKVIVGVTVVGKQRDRRDQEPSEREQ
ncbi:hypothetical protein [Rugamonas sp.]|uniref:hypothetical protein n=1 Tax=Rugamonas sp. TaxID=1926287 RepID=UPI0025D2A790|nr:hypothetical protein [Rugamonas sp.]